MTELNRVGSSDNFNFGWGIPSFLQVCEKCSQTKRKTDTVMVLLYVYISIEKKFGC